jgi:hypothetical protein
MTATFSGPREERASADNVASLVEEFVHRRLRAERWDTAAGQWVRDSRATICSIH